MPSENDDWTWVDVLFGVVIVCLLGMVMLSSGLCA